MKVLGVEKEIGIKTFFTPFEGTGGKLRLQPEDFIVQELSNFPDKSESGRYLVATVTSKNWETNLLIRELSDWLHISRQRVNFAGTKDKRAKTTQLMSFSEVALDDLSKVKIKNVAIENIYRSARAVKLGDLTGNRFEITVRAIRDDVDSEYVDKITSFIADYGGFPNFFGVQRFGIVRPVTHTVGKFIVKDDFEKAVMTYIGNPMAGEDKETYDLRKALEETRDYSAALSAYPKKLNFEKAILNRLVVDPSDFIGGLKELPKNLITMFVYAYQSYIFNFILSERIERKIPLNQAVVGDVILPVVKGVVSEREIKVKPENIKKVNSQVSKGKAVVSGILLGSESAFSEGEMGEIEHKIVDREKLNPRDFIIPGIPFASSLGSRRPLLAPVKNLDFKLVDDDLNPGKSAMVFKFDLQRGSYATSLLREILKADDIKNY